MVLLGEDRHLHMKDIQRRHCNGLGALGGLGIDVKTLIRHVIEHTEGVTQEASARVPQHFLRHVADTVFNGLKTAAAKLQVMSAT